MVTVVLPVMPPRTAAMIVEPDETAVARPPALTTAITVFEEAHVTWLIKFWVLASEYVPVAVNCCVAPAKKVGDTGVTVIEVRIGAIVMLRDLVTVWVGLLASLTCAVKLKVPVAVGIPLMAPLVALRVKPRGRDPLMSDQM